MSLIANFNATKSAEIVIINSIKSASNTLLQMPYVLSANLLTIA